MRLVWILTAVALTAACGGDGSNNTSVQNNDDTNNIAENNGEVTGLADRPALQEPAGCLDEAENPVFTQDEREYGMQTGTDVEMYRAEYYAHCGSSKKIEIDWLAILSAEGFEEDELASPGIVVDAMKPFLIAADDFCFADGMRTRYDAVEKVVFTATEDASRVGLCLDDASGTIVSRFLLTPGDGTADFWNQEMSSEWLDMNL